MSRIHDFAFQPTIHIFKVYFTFVLTSPPAIFLLTGLLVGGISGFGVTAGVHRYWCHRSYKAKKPLQLLLLFCYSVSGQNTIFEWVRDHRVHHKHSETAADPHDVTRGFWFSHVGWLMMKKHPEVLRAGRAVDMSDILRDPLVAMHTRYFLPLKILCCFIIPTILPIVCWSEKWDQAIVSQPFVRYILSLNFTWAVNSFAHIWGNKPYDKYIKPTENWGVSMVAMGEGWHNYHHTFPWDYKAAELAYCLNFTTFVLDLFAKIGWAYDMKEASPKLIKDVSQKRGKLHFIADTSVI
ncbi:hypothetical protein EVAR_89063_1 [Eumeta japonica]|uniref:Fatty acid desaturase domain-containing protein n=1 Tax=Eumeta variegata TaxID=151549 RepID=A0A4C1XJC1_EUMVA|nr:hypothetical protein EVAR_89063_1 [Eumeta japonica]